MLFATRHFFKNSNVFPILRISNGMLKNLKCKKVYNSRIIARSKEQQNYLKERWKTYKIVLNIPYIQVKISFQSIEDNLK